MKELFELMEKAWAENCPERHWFFEMHGHVNQIRIHLNCIDSSRIDIHVLGADGYYKLDSIGIAAASYFIKENLKKTA